MSLSYKMSLSMNYLSFEPVKKNSFGFTTGGFRWYGPVGGVDYYVYPEKGLPSSKRNTYGTYRYAGLGKWNPNNHLQTNLNLVGSFISIYINERSKFPGANTPENMWWRGTVTEYNPVNGKHTVYFNNYGIVRLDMKKRFAFSIDYAPCCRSKESPEIFIKNSHRKFEIENLDLLNYVNSKNVIDLTQTSDSEKTCCNEVIKVVLE